jgi:hypothetical protein
MMEIIQILHLHDTMELNCNFVVLSEWKPPAVVPRQFQPEVKIHLMSALWLSVLDLTDCSRAFKLHFWIRIIFHFWANISGFLLTQSETKLSKRLSVHWLICKLVHIFQSMLQSLQGRTFVFVGGTKRKFPCSAISLRRRQTSSHCDDDFGQGLTHRRPIRAAGVGFFQQLDQRL